MSKRFFDRKLYKAMIKAKGDKKFTCKYNARIICGIPELCAIYRKEYRSD